MVCVIDQIQALETSLNRLKHRVPELPITQILTSRMLVLLGRELSNSLDQRLRPYGLTEIEFRTLMNVYSMQGAPMYPGELCTNLGNSPANITRITDNLVERGLLSRVADETDRRRLLLTLTPAGEQLAQDVLPVMLSSVRASYQEFSAAELEQLLGCLRQLAQLLDAAAARQSATAQLEASA